MLASKLKLASHLVSEILIFGLNCRRITKKTQSKAAQNARLAFGERGEAMAV